MAPWSSGAEWRTDANGLFMMQRIRRTNSSGFFPGYVVAEKEAQNYYPATSMAELQSNTPDGPGIAVAFASALQGMEKRLTGIENPTSASVRAIQAGFAVLDARLAVMMQLIQTTLARPKLKL